MGGKRGRVDVKICGLTSADDAAAARDLGADYLGFVFYPRSPRAVTTASAARILCRLGAGVRAVGVFVNAAPEDVRAAVRDCGLWGVQFHGDEAAGAGAGLEATVWRAVWLREGVWRPDPAGWPAERYVADAAPRGVYGGSGCATDWARAADLAGRARVMLAGGLSPENVVDAIRRVRPAGVDVVSGVEASPGKKDRARMKAFIEKVRSHDDEPGP